MNEALLLELRRLHDDVFRWLLHRCSRSILSPKEIGELSLLYRVTTRTGTGAPLARILDSIRCHSLKSPRDTESLSGWLKWAIVARIADNAPEDARFALPSAIAAQLADASSLYAWNLPELRYYLDLLGVEHQLAPLETLLRTSLITARPDSAVLTRHETYEITHTVFVGTDFGRTELPGFCRNEIDALQEYLDELIVQSSMVGDLDLTSELLASCACLRSLSEAGRHVWWEICRVPRAAVDEELAGCFFASTGAAHSGLFHLAITVALSTALTLHLLRTFDDNLKKSDSG
jgi:hypothetical protein